MSDADAAADRIRERLDALSAGSISSPRDLIAKMADEIRSALDSGVRLSEIAEALNREAGEGCRITVATFRSYWQSVRREKGIAPSRVGRKPGERPKASRQPREAPAVRLAPPASARDLGAEPSRSSDARQGHASGFRLDHGRKL